MRSLNQSQAQILGRELHAVVVLRNLPSGVSTMMAVACANWPVLGSYWYSKTRRLGQRVNGFLGPVRKCQPSAAPARP